MGIVVVAMNVILIMEIRSAPKNYQSFALATINFSKDLTTTSLQVETFTMVGQAE